MDLKNLFARRWKPKPPAPVATDAPIAPPEAEEVAAEPVAYPGSTPETAIVVDSVHAEYEWMKTTYPGYMPKSQDLMLGEARPFDRMIWYDAAGETVTIYFDVTSFYGKEEPHTNPWDRVPVPFPEVVTTIQTEP